mgnify:FL=1
MLGDFEMKKITILTLLFVFMVSSSVQAFQWAYSFVVWDGKIYEVKEDVLIEESEIGKIIGKVETQPYYYSDYTDAMKYYGNASNVYPIGTQYYEIKGMSTSDAIAIKEDNHWVKAVYVDKATNDYPLGTQYEQIKGIPSSDAIAIKEDNHKAPFHIMNFLTNPLPIFSIVIIALILIGVIFRSKQIKNEN